MTHVAIAMARRIACGYLASADICTANALGYAAENEPARGFGVFRWGKRKKGYGYLPYHCRTPARHCLTYEYSALRELAMPAQIPRSHGAISPPFLIIIAPMGRFHPSCWIIAVGIIGGHYHRYV